MIGPPAWGVNTRGGKPQAPNPKSENGKPQTPGLKFRPCPSVSVGVVPRFV
jgi:hypothetical protein